MSRIKVKRMPKDAASNCNKCKRILTGGEDVGVLPTRDSLGRSICICMSCRNG